MKVAYKVNNNKDLTKFPGGEWHVKNTLARCSTKDDVVIDVRCRTADDFMAAMTLTDAVRRMRPNSLTLLIPYFPGARQDRSENGSPLTAKVYADIINLQKYDEVIALDTHSHVADALINRLKVIPQHAFIRTFINQYEIKRITGIISPDSGSSKKCHELVKQLAEWYPTDLVECSKTRNPTTGALSGFKVPKVDEQGTYILADDICDGGGTFIGLASEWSKVNGNQSSLILAVSHGIFSQGFENLRNKFREIVTTDSFWPLNLTVPVKIVKVEELIDYAE